LVGKLSNLILEKRRKEGAKQVFRRSVSERFSLRREAWFSEVK